MFFSDAVFCQKLGLAFGGGPAVAAHGWHDEGLGTGLFEEVQHGRDDRLQIADTAASDRHCDARSRLKLASHPGKLLLDRFANIQRRGRWILLSH